MPTAHNIRRTGPARVAGRHLSDAANEPGALPDAIIQALSPFVPASLLLTPQQRADAAAFAGDEPFVIDYEAVDRAMEADKKAGGYQQRENARAQGLQDRMDDVRGWNGGVL